MSAFIILVHEFVDYFDFNIIPSFIKDFYVFILRISNSFFFKNFSNLSFKDFKLSSIRKDAKYFFNNIDKATVYINQSHISENSNTAKFMNSKSSNKNFDSTNNTYNLSSSDNNTNSNKNNNSSNSQGIGSFNTLVPNEPVDRFLPEEGVNRNRDSGRGIGEIAWLRREERFAFNRWEQERNLYPHLSQRQWAIRIDGPRMRENYLRRQRERIRWEVLMFYLLYLNYPYHILHTIGLSCLNYLYHILHTIGLSCLNYL